jgi:hypothetical protein
MSTPASVRLWDHFAALRDPRQGARALYPLPEILLLVLFETIAGAGDFVETTLCGMEHLAFLRRFYRYENGIQSHDTLYVTFRGTGPGGVQDLLSGVGQRPARRPLTTWPAHTPVNASRVTSRHPRMTRGRCGTLRPSP